MKTDFLQTRGYYKNLRKLRPNQSVGEVFLTKNESDHLDKYIDLCKHEKQQQIFNNDFNKQLTSNKRSLRKLGYDIKGRYSYSNLRKIKF
jgi:hypothetical protein